METDGSKPDGCAHEEAGEEQQRPGQAGGLGRAHPGRYERRAQRQAAHQSQSNGRETPIWVREPARLSARGIRARTISRAPARRASPYPTIRAASPASHSPKTSVRARSSRLNERPRNQARQANPRYPASRPAPGTPPAPHRFLRWTFLRPPAAEAAPGCTRPGTRGPTKFPQGSLRRRFSPPAIKSSIRPAAPELFPRLPLEWRIHRNATGNPSSRGVSGAIALPGDKSISHRYAMIAAIAEGTRASAITRPARIATPRWAACARWGSRSKSAGTRFASTARGLTGCAQPAGDLDAGNSGSTIRMLSGILAAQPFGSAHRRRRIALAPAHAAHHDAAGGDGRAHRGARRASFRRSKSTAARCGRSITRCPWPARR